MIIELNTDCLSYKKGSRVDIDKLKPQHKTYFLNRIKDSKKDNCVTIIEEKKEVAKNVLTQKKSIDKNVKATETGGENDSN